MSRENLAPLQGAERLRTSWVESTVGELATRVGGFVRSVARQLWRNRLEMQVILWLVNGS